MNQQKENQIRDVSVTPFSECGKSGKTLASTIRFHKNFILYAVIGVVILLIVSCYDYASQAFTYKISGILKNHTIAVCRLKELTDFPWEKARFSWSGLLLHKLKMSFVNNQGKTKNITLPLGSYYASEDYVAHSPLNKELTPDSALIFTVTAKKNTEFIHIRSIQDAEFYFISKLLETLAAQKKTIPFAFLTDFKWSSAAILFHGEQYFYELEFTDGDNGKPFILTLPSDVISFGDGLLTLHSHNILYSDNITVSMSDGTIFLDYVPN